MNPLTKKEQEVLALLARGVFSTRRMAVHITWPAEEITEVKKSLAKKLSQPPPLELDISNLEWDDEEAEEGYLHSHCYLRCGPSAVPMMVHAFRVSPLRERKKGEPSSWGPHPSLSTTRLWHFEEFMNLDEECNYDSMWLPPFKGYWCIFMVPLGE